jgi:hypothetical protein
VRGNLKEFRGGIAADRIEGVSDQIKIGDF